MQNKKLNKTLFRKYANKTVTVRLRAGFKVPECSYKLGTTFRATIVSSGACFETIGGKLHTIPWGLFKIIQSKELKAKPKLCVFLVEYNKHVNAGSEMYDACVVVAGSAKAAKRIMPNGLDYTDAFINQSYWRPENLTVRKLGPSTGRFKAGKVICASFNAG